MRILTLISLLLFASPVFAEDTYVLSHWIGTGTAQDPARPALRDKYIGRIQDITGQRRPFDKPNPNVAVFFVQADKSEIDKIEADPDFIVISRDTRPQAGDVTPQERSGLVEYLKAKGMADVAAADAVGQEKTRSQTVNRLKTEAKKWEKKSVIGP